MAADVGVGIRVEDVVSIGTDFASSRVFYTQLVVIGKILQPFYNIHRIITVSLFIMQESIFYVLE